nr:increased DNA methylation 1 isoform X2 [Ipomoea trifida]
MKLDSDVALEDVPELADSEVQIRDVQEQESGVDNPADGVNEEINGTTSIAVPELADSEVQIRDVQEQESGVDNPAGGANEEINNGTTSIGELSSVRFRDSKGIVVYRRSKELNKEAVKECS